MTDDPGRTDTGSRARLLVAAAACALGFVVVLVLVVAHWSPLQRLDVSVADHLNAWVAPRPALTTFWKIVTTALTPLSFEIASVVAAALAWWRGRRKLAVFLLVAIFGVLGLYDIVKVAVDRPRPTVPVPLIAPYGASFPSGHAAMSLTGLSLVVLVVGRWLRSTIAVIALAAGATLVAAAVGFSRLALGAHYVSDVVGGWLLAGTWVLILCAAFDIRAELPTRVSGQRQPIARPDPDRPRGRSVS